MERLAGSGSGARARLLVMDSSKRMDAVEPRSQVRIVLRGSISTAQFLTVTKLTTFAGIVLVRVRSTWKRLRFRKIGSDAVKRLRTANKDTNLTKKIPHSGKTERELAGLAIEFE